jgi:hypothetical protein
VSPVLRDLLPREEDHDLAHACRETPPGFPRGARAEADPADPAARAITYKDLALKVDRDNLAGWRQSYPRYGSLKTALYHVSSYEAEHGRPMISVFVVRGSNPGKGFPGSGCFVLARRLDRLHGDSAEAEYAFWQSEVRAYVEHWSAARTRAADAGLSDE